MYLYFISKFKVKQFDTLIILGNLKCDNKQFTI